MPYGQPVKISLSGLEASIHGIVNRTRQHHGLMALVYDAALAAVAKSHSSDMARRRSFSHTNPEGRGPAERGLAAGYPIREVVRGGYAEELGENIHKSTLYRSVVVRGGKSRYDWFGQTHVAGAVVRGWMQSPGHRK